MSSLWQRAENSQTNVVKKCGKTKTRELSWKHRRDESNASRCGVELIVFWPNSTSPSNSILLSGSIEMVRIPRKCELFELLREFQLYKRVESTLIEKLEKIFNNLKVQLIIKVSLRRAKNTIFEYKICVGKSEIHFRTRLKWPIKFICFFWLSAMFQWKWEIQLTTSVSLRFMTFQAFYNCRRATSDFWEFLGKFILRCWRVIENLVDQSEVRRTHRREGGELRFFHKQISYFTPAFDDNFTLHEDHENFQFYNCFHFSATVAVAVRWRDES